MLDIQRIDALISAVDTLGAAIHADHESVMATEARLARLERQVSGLYRMQPVLFALGVLLGKWL